METKKRRPTKKQVAFAEEFTRTGNGTQSALKVYDTDDYMTAHSIATENLQKPSVRSLIDDFAEIAAKNIQKLASGAKNEQVRLAANKDMLDRGGFKPIEKSANLNINRTIPVNETPEVIAEAKRLLREKMTHEPAD